MDAASLCVTCPVSQGSGGGVFANDNEEQRAIEHRSIEQRSRPEMKDQRMANKIHALRALITALIRATCENVHAYINTNYFHAVRGRNTVYTAANNRFETGFAGLRVNLFL